MRCQACEQEIGLATVCPYCGKRVRPSESAADAHGERRKKGPQGGFRGRLDPEDGAASGGAKPLGSWLSALLRLVLDPSTPRSVRMVIVAAILYIMSPLDFLPGGLIPVIGWIDDLIIGWLAWTYLKPHLGRYQR